MASNRNMTFVTSYVYHVYNRGIDGRSVFTNTLEHDRFISLIDFYRHSDVPMRYSKYQDLPASLQTEATKNIEKLPCMVTILAYCLMPNHFHLLLRQEKEHGIIQFVGNISNGHAKYYNSKHKRKGPLFQNSFKAVWVETDEQLLHVSRYIHLNPVTSSIIPVNRLESYPWSSYRMYLGNETSFVETQEVLSHFQTTQKYKQFIVDQIDYAKELHKYKYLTMEEGVQT
jgi:putative transposase